MANQPASIKLIMQTGPQPGQEIVIQDRPQIIGRGSGSSIVIPDKTLSRRHARIWATPDGVAVEDLGSTNGMFINEQRVSGSQWLRPGDTLRLGDITFNLQVDQPGQGSIETMVPGTVRAPAGSDHTMVPAAPAAPFAPPVYAPPVQPGPNPWIWVGLAVIIATLIVGGALGYLYYSRVYQPEATAQAVLSPTLEPTQMPTATPIPTQTPTPTSIPEQTPTPTLSPTPAPIQVPGIPAAGANERQPPPDISSKISPFCNREVEVKANEPVLIAWQRRVADDGETDYLAQWLEAAYFDLRLDGRPVTDLGALNYYRDESCAENGLCGPTLNWWVNIGLLETGSHHLSLELYTDREISNGLDVDPADGRPDLFGPGPAGEGFCDIVVAPAATPLVEVTPTPIPTPKTDPGQTQDTAAPLGIFQDFERESTWKRGDQPYGQFTRSSAQVHSGSYAGQLSYNFPTANNDYVVFLQSRALAGRPNAISAWVYGDGAGHFLNIWIKDANGQTWQMSFGQVKHTGWQEMTAFLDPGHPWPSAHISGPNNGAIDYPISFQALVLDDGSDTYSGSGTIYIDDLNSQEGAAAPPPQVSAPTPAAPSSQAPANSGIYELRIGNQHRYEEPWGAPKSGDPCEAARTKNWDDKHPDYRGFNVELLLTNNSAVKVQDNWGENMRFFTSSGQEVVACYYVYDASPEGPVPGGTSSVTFFTVVPKGQFVQVMQLNLNGQFMQLCLDGRGGWSACN
ncbi:MAG: FHA domain-containing protein [Anaerolineae bacterium]|nr:FHA domain-containing protein [Anaerolineae bacterium]